MRDELKTIIEEPLSVLLDMDVNSPNENNLDILFYKNVMISYLKGDVNSLKRSIDRYENEHSPFYWLARLRLLIRTKEITAADIGRILEQIKSMTSDSKLLGEAHFIAGYASYDLKMYSESVDYYTLAIVHFKQSGLNKKYLKSKQNKLASQTCYDENYRCIPEYHSIYVEARRFKDYITAGLCLMNISREYQKVGAFQSALNAINQSLIFFRKDLGMVHYYLAVAHRAHIHLQLQDEKNFLLDVETCLSCQFPEVHAAVRVLEGIDFSNITAPGSLLKALNNTWHERLLNLKNEKDAFPELTDHEEKLLRVLKGGAKDRLFVAEQIFGDKINSESSLGRLKNLLFRFKQKNPNLILSKDGKIYISSKYKGVS